MKKREVTREMDFKLPHFKPAIKLGSHDDPTPAGGFIVGLEKREDGLYAQTEWNEQGDKAQKDGAYRYHSPEVIWEGALENPNTGALIEGPLIVGDALLHTPHLGEDTAFYTSEPQINPKEKNMNETFSVPNSLKGVWDSFVSSLGAKPNPEQNLKPDQLAAIEKERDAFKAQAAQADVYKAELDKIKKADEFKTEVSKISAEFQKKDDKGRALYGMSYVELSKAEEAATVIAGMSPEQRDWVMRNFKAYAAQIDETKIVSELGSEGKGAATPVQVLNAAVQAKMKELKTDYNSALALVSKEHPELVTQYQAQSKEK